MASPRSVFTQDSIGLAGDYFLDPVSYITPMRNGIAIRSVDRVNDTSLRIGNMKILRNRQSTRMSPSEMLTSSIGIRR